MTPFPTVFSFPPKGREKTASEEKTSMFELVGSLVADVRLVVAFDLFVVVIVREIRNILLCISRTRRSLKRLCLGQISRVQLVRVSVSERV